MDPLLLVMNPRRIARCIAAIEALDVDKVWLVAMTERQLEDVVHYVVDKASAYSHLLLLSDDTVPTQGALDLVLAALEEHPVVTGYCNLDASSPFVNITRRPFQCLDRSIGSDYDFFRRDVVATWSAPLVRTYFAGACLTGMSRDMWWKYPFRVFPGSEPGYASDWMLSTRLQRDGVPIWAPRGAFVEHVKAVWNEPDRTDPERRLLIGEIPAEIRWDTPRR